MPANAVPGPYSPDAGAAGRRALRGAGAGAADRARPGGAGGAAPSSTAADNMTERMGALGLLVAHGQARGGARAPSTPPGRTTGW